MLAVGFGEWSERYYSVLLTNALFFLWQGYLVIGGYGITAALCWIFFSLNSILPNRAVAPK